jgi:hypothetical protein
VDDVVAEFGRRLNIPVAKTLALGGDFIVLLDWRKAYEVWILRNLFQLRADGTVVWTISQPEPMGAVVAVELQYGTLLAWTWGCYMLHINERTGKVDHSEFTK